MAYYGSSSDGAVQGLSEIGIYAGVGVKSNAFFVNHKNANVYSESLIRSSITSPGFNVVAGLVAAGNFALVIESRAHTVNSPDYQQYSSVKAINQDKTYINAPNTSRKRFDESCGTFESDAVITGEYYQEYDKTTTIDVYTADLTMSTLSELINGLVEYVVVSVGNKLLIIGGVLGSNHVMYNGWYVLSKDLTLETKTDWPRPGFARSGVSLGNIAIIGAGAQNNTGFPNKDFYLETTAIDQNLTISNPEGFSTRRKDYGAISLGEYALFSGGASGGTSYTNEVEVYNNELIKSTSHTLVKPRGNIGSACVKDYALFGGGNDYFNSYNSVDVYTA